MKSFLAFIAVATLMVIAAIGLSGDGPLWTKYFGAGTVLLMLLLILQQLSNIPSTVELRKLLLGAEAAAAARSEQAIPEDDDIADSTKGRRSARN
jgi:hypothetical protein